MLARERCLYSYGPKSCGIAAKRHILIAALGGDTTPSAPKELSTLSPFGPKGPSTLGAEGSVNPSRFREYSQPPKVSLLSYSAGMIFLVTQ